MENYNDDKTKGLDKTKLIKNVKATYAKDENEQLYRTKKKTKTNTQRTGGGHKILK